LKDKRDRGLVFPYFPTLFLIQRGSNSSLSQSRGWAAEGRWIASLPLLYPDGSRRETQDPLHSFLFPSNTREGCPLGKKWLIPLPSFLPPLIEGGGEEETFPPLPPLFLSVKPCPRIMKEIENDGAGTSLLSFPCFPLDQVQTS